MFLAGIVLFAVARMKQSREDEALEKQVAEDRSRQRNAAIAQGVTVGVAAITSATQQPRHAAKNFWTTRGGGLGIAKRLAVALFVTISGIACSALALTTDSEKASLMWVAIVAVLIFLIVPTVYALRNHARAAQHLLIANITYSAALLVFAGKPEGVLLWGLAPSLILLGAMWWRGRRTV